MRPDGKNIIILFTRARWINCDVLYEIDPLTSLGWIHKVQNDDDSVEQESRKNRNVQKCKGGHNSRKKIKKKLKKKKKKKKTYKGYRNARKNVDTKCGPYRSDWKEGSKTKLKIVFSDFWTLEKRSEYIDDLYQPKPRKGPEEIVVIVNHFKKKHHDSNFELFEIWSHNRRWWDPRTRSPQGYRRQTRTL